MECCPHCSLAKSPRPPLLPPPTHLYTTNEVPLESEIRNIRERINIGRARLTELDAEVGSLATCAAFRHERQKTQENIEQHCSILSPIRSFPYDVLSEIFSWTLPSPAGGKFYSTDISLSPWLLSYVCRRWRNLVVSLPALWSNIRIENIDIPLLPLLNLQLDRSASCPLTLKFSSSDIEAFDLILDHADRLYTVDLWLSDWMMPLLDLKATGRLPLLRSLRFSMSSPLLTCRAFEVAPRLSQVYAYFDNPTLPVPYAQLTRLRHGTPQGLPLVIAPLKLAHNLVELTLVNNDTPSHDVQGTIELSRLCLLRIYRGSFLDQMVLPALENICIYFDPFPLVSLVHRSSCRLRRLIILPSPRDNIVTLLEHIPTLLELHVAS
ncbi:hypothetical protein C8J57DRAFT_1126537, partial [Mycena rebaudengoi]